MHIIITLNIHNEAIATSGDYENWLIDKPSGMIYSHIINPKKEGAMDKKYASTTVIAENCTKADAFATGMMAMGSEESIKTANKTDGIEVIYIVREKSSYDIKYSDNAEDYQNAFQVYQFDERCSGW